MIIKNRELVVEPGSPFLNDELNRLESAEVLTQFVLSTQDPMVVCLDAPWGQGKTTFLRMWEQHLKDSAVPTIYFNAWENDFTDDALVSIIGEISSGIDELSTPEDISKTKEYLDKAKGFGVTLLKRTVPVAAKVATAGALDLDKVTEQALAGFAESIAKEELESYEKSKKTLSAFRDSLQELATSISSKEDPKPLVFIIDELDRCRPNFSIEVLEKAKHFFNVSNIVFVLGADKTQLGHSIKAVYGQDLNVNGYLRRFIDFDYLLPPPEKGLFVKALFKKFDFNSYFSKKTGRESQYEGRQALEMFSEFFEIYNLTLREQEHCCSLLSLAIRTTPNDYALYPLFLCYLIVLKVKEPDLYKSFVNEEMTPAALFEHLSSKSGAEELIANNYGAVLETYIMTCKSHRHGTNDVVEKYNEVVNSTTASSEQKARAQRILELINKFDWDGGVGILGYLVNKIEIASRFSS
ncbi:KAP family P-loop NTPase fold protein [Shewanella woodyi]|uniref:KAP family P-loop NTPase fold protein n=1 Tax=Shewanella woodyi TaxID=60961 RepID=UPI0007F97473|nr:P-loop NTPase fold protein [Shewanella woodyi]